MRKFSEKMVPRIVTRPRPETSASDLSRNADVFDSHYR